MAKTFSRLVATLDTGLVLSPERYNPAKYIVSNGGAKLSEIVFEFKEVVSRSSRSVSPGASAIVLDTSDSQDGFLNGDKVAEPVLTLGSAKKKVARGDVIISRLRPYLRQVAFIGDTYDKTLLLGSTEYFVLRPLNPGDDIGFLVPFLLSPVVQNILNISVEGAHHPRFSIDTLMQLEVPRHIYEERDHISKKVHEALFEYNHARITMKELCSIEG